MKVATDTNVLAYAEGTNDRERQRQARNVLGRLAGTELIIPVQVLGELYNVLVRRARRPREEAGATVLAWATSYRTAPTTHRAAEAGVEIATAHQLGVWDSIIIAVAAESGCRLLLSEDLQDGFTYHGVTVVNPFAVPRHPLLDALLAPDAEPAG